MADVFILGHGTSGVVERLAFAGLRVCRHRSRVNCRRMVQLPCIGPGFCQSVEALVGAAEQRYDSAAATLYSDMFSWRPHNAAGAHLRRLDMNRIRWSALLVLTLLIVRSNVPAKAQMDKISIPAGTPED